MNVLTAVSSTNSSFAFIAFLIIAFFILLIPIFIGVYVYNDAKKRGMNAALWTLVAILAPALVGLIIYLIVRTDNAQCPSCKAPVSESFTVCPKCGAPLKDRCPSCGFRAEPDWKVCPQCTAELPTEGRVSVSFDRRDKGLSKVLLAVILVPVILFVLSVVAMLLFRTNTGFSGGGMGTTTDLTQADFTGNDSVQTWFTECDEKPDGVYMLCHDEIEEAGAMEWLVYMKGYTISGMGTHPQSGGWFLKPSVNVSVSGRTAEGENFIFYIATVGYPESDLKMTLNGKKLVYESTYTGSSVKPFTTREDEKVAVAENYP